MLSRRQVRRPSGRKRAAVRIAVVAGGGPGEGLAQADAVMDARFCGGCRLLYGFSPFRPWKEAGAVARARHGETKWCPKCETPQRVLLAPTVWRLSVAPFELRDHAADLRMAYALGIGAPPREEPDTRSVQERLEAMGLEAV